MTENVEALAKLGAAVSEAVTGLPEGEEPWHDVVRNWLAGGATHTRPPSGRAARVAVLALARLMAERDEARAWVRRLTAEARVLTCVYCGQAYPPGTPEHGADVLTAHGRVCAKHPMRAAEQEIEELKDRLAVAGAGEVVRAIRAFTVDAPDGQPNGKAERRIGELRDALKRGSIRDARAAFRAYCDATADDLKRLCDAAGTFFGGDFNEPDEPPEA